jgi:hypothetical protein
LWAAAENSADALFLQLLISQSLTVGIRIRPIGMDCDQHRVGENAITAKGYWLDTQTNFGTQRVIKAKEL